MTRLSLCMIARNEEQLLQGCLDSVKGVVDEVIIVDTGSTDRTRDIALKAGAKVIDQPWHDDFAAPRNAALNAATGDWVLQLDADERLTPQAGAALKAALKKGGFACGMLRLHDATGFDVPFADVLSGKSRIADPVYLPRLLKRTADLEYRGVIHESVSDWLVRQRMSLTYVEADIIHFGNVPALRQGKAKSRRNIELLEKRCTLEPDSMVPFGYLALELLKAGDRARAQQIVEQGWRIAERRPEHQTVLRLADARATLQLERGDADGVLETVALAETIEGAQPDLSFLKGCALELRGMRAAFGSRARQRQLDEALTCFEDAQRPRTGSHFAQYMEGVNGWSALVHQGNTLLALGRSTEARKLFADAISLKPDALEAHVGLAEAELDCGNAERALKGCEPALSDDPDGWLIAAWCAVALDSPQDAQTLFGNACARGKKGYLSPHRQQRHAELACIISASLGRPIHGPGVTGAITGVMARAAMPLARHEDFARPLSLLMRAVLAANQTHLLEPLFEPRAEAMFPGIVRALARLGIEADGQRDPAIVEVPNAWAEGWIRACQNPRLIVKRCDRHVVRVGTLELKWAQVLADPVPAVRTLMATLGEAHDDLLLRYLIDNYPGAGANA
ncbi:MAG: glycosyltransferase [Archangiaceae bacterium]|nr:glycosyltransferase [Archangiaceae bacterium]